MIFHIPHNSTFIPGEYRNLFELSDEDLQAENFLLADHHTRDLYYPSLERGLYSPSLRKGDTKVVFGVSRLLVDPERFDDDNREPMVKFGMGAVYTRCQNGQPLKNVTPKIREELMDKYYYPHHAELARQVAEELRLTGQAFIVDCHSFPKTPLLFEEQKPRAEICIGADQFHTPLEVQNFLRGYFESKGFLVALNDPFAGAIVPLEHYNKNPNVRSVMLEIRRDLYMDEVTGKKNDNFERMIEIIKGAVQGLREIDLTLCSKPCFQP